MISRSVLLAIVLTSIARTSARLPRSAFSKSSSSKHNLFSKRELDETAFCAHNETMSDRFEALQALVTVVSEGGFSAGAKRLGIAKSAVSRRIRDLEDRLGARLFDRTTRRIQLTESGRALHERAVALLAALEEAEEAASSASGELKGSIRVAAPVSFAVHC